MSKLNSNELLYLRNKSNMYLEAYEEIKDAIINLRFSPGEFLSENSLAKALNMSRTPVREALKKLANEGLVCIIPGKGVSVSPVSVKDLKDIYEIRKSLECLALKTSLERITLKHLDELESKWLKLSALLQNKGDVDWLLISSYDSQLHSLLVDQCDNERLKLFLQILKQQILRYQLMAAKALGNADETIKQHLEIIALLKIKDLDNLNKLLVEHFDRSEQSIINSNSL